MVEDLAHSRLPKHLANERNSGYDIWLYNVPWYLVLPASIYGLQLVTCFSEVGGVLVNVFWAIIYLRPLRRHYHKLDAFSRVN
jgi:hypothetical protein